METDNAFNRTPRAVDDDIGQSHPAPFSIRAHQEQIAENERGKPMWMFVYSPIVSSRRFVRLRTAPVIPLHETGRPVRFQPW